MFPLRLTPVTLTLAALCGVACSSSSNNDGTPPPAATGQDGGIPANAPDGPGITAKNCPATPTNVNIAQAAPVWYGFVQLTATVPGGTPDTLEVQVLDPSTKLWVTTYGRGGQKQDGTFAVSVSPTVDEASKTKEFKARVRARLDGCPPTGWAESPTFTLGNPISGTSWTATIPSALFYQYLNVSHVGTGTSQGPYTLSDADVVHTMTFNADGSYAESFSYGIKSLSTTPGDLYDGCNVHLSYVGTWILRLDGSPTVSISARKPNPAGVTTGSTCTAPPVSDWTASQPGGAPTRIQPASMYLNIDYQNVLDDPPGKPVWSAGGDLSNALSATLAEICDNVGPNTATINGSLNPQQVRYLKN